jgi:hypothetical protein
MNCIDARRILTTRPESLRSDVSDHLDACASCAYWLTRNDAFDQLWLETRPESVDAGSFDPLWAQVRALEDAAPAATWIDHLVGTPSRRVFFVFAQAAALLLATFALDRRSNDTGLMPQIPPIASLPTTGVKPIYTVEEGQSLILWVEAGRVTEILKDHEAISPTVEIAAELDLLNYFETL